MVEKSLAAEYTAEEQRMLLALARQTLYLITAGDRPPKVDLSLLPPALRELRACFVTLRTCGERALRGCTGTLVARRPLADEVVNMTVQTALHDPRFFPVVAAEVDGLHIEISVLTPSQRLTFTSPQELISRVRPHVDGVTLYLDQRRATFLPSVWESYPEPEIFLSLLCQKMGLSPEAWQNPRLLVETYQTVMLEEPVGPPSPAAR